MGEPHSSVGPRGANCFSSGCLACHDHLSVLTLTMKVTGSQPTSAIDIICVLMHLCLSGIDGLFEPLEQLISDFLCQC